MKKIGLLVVLSFFLINLEAGEVAEITVSTGAFDRFDTPVSLSLDPLTFEADSNLVFYEKVKKDKLPVDFQIEQTSAGRMLSWVLSSGTKAGSKRIFILETGTTAKKERVINVSDKGDAILITSGNDKIMEYQYGVMLPPPGVKYEYRRSGFIHPLWSPTGEILTNVQPGDHYHHYGVWNPWTRTTFEGESVDFWNLADGQGTVRFKAFSSLAGGLVNGGFEAVQEHVVFKRGYEKIALNEKVAVKIWNVKDEQSRKVWLWDFSSTLNCASASPVVLNAYRYGGFSIRATPEWNTKTSTILTSEGKTRKDADNTTGRWMFCNGNAGGKQSGVMFLSYPANYNHPEPMRIWPEDNNDVFMNFCPTKNTDWTIDAGKDYVLRYRVVVYSGEMTAARAEQYWQDFANPPSIEVRKNNK